jgi:subfamily B ATP-binding cassette protein HlyB/CyaB
VQRLYVPEQGRVLVDGVDIGLIDAAQLRRQIGVVLQENQLFNRSVRENIAISRPGRPAGGRDACGPAGRRTRVHQRAARGLRHPVGEQGSIPLAAGSASALPLRVRCSPTRAS